MTTTKQNTKPLRDALAELCDRCHAEIEAEAIEKGWPVPVTPLGGDPAMDCEYVCPDCLDARCYAGHILRGDTESSDCPECDDGEIL